MSGRPRALLAAAAEQYLAAGWPVAPGAWWSPQHQRYQCGRGRCRVFSPHPVDVTAGPLGPCQAPARSCAITAADIAGWWDVHSYAVLLATGTAVDAVEGPDQVIQALDRTLLAAGHQAPLLISPGRGRTLLSQPIPADEALWLTTATAQVVLRGTGSWVPLPPSAVRLGPVKWTRSPRHPDWLLPPGNAVTAALQEILPNAGAVTR